MDGGGWAVSSGVPGAPGLPGCAGLSGFTRFAALIIHHVMNYRPAMRAAVKRAGAPGARRAAGVNGIVHSGRSAPVCFRGRPSGAAVRPPGSTSLKDNDFHCPRGAGGIPLVRGFSCLYPIHRADLHGLPRRLPRRPARCVWGWPSPPGCRPSWGWSPASSAGCVAGLLPGSSLQVSGPGRRADRAGLRGGAASTGSAPSACWCSAPGVLQIALGALRLGRWFRAVSVAVVQGMLAGIGLVLMAGQVYTLAGRRGARRRPGSSPGCRGS